MCSKSLILRLDFNWLYTSDGRVFHISEFDSGQWKLWCMKWRVQLHRLGVLSFQLVCVCNQWHCVTSLFSAYGFSLYLWMKFSVYRKVRPMSDFGQYSDGYCCIHGWQAGHLAPRNPCHWWRKWPSYTHTHTRLTALSPGLPRWAGTRKVKPIWISLKQETVSGSGISWAIRKSAPRSRQITTPSPHHPVFYRLDALPAA